MAGEIRVLEDQLYEADYQNRILYDQLQRCQVQAKTARAAAAGPASADPPAARPSRTTTPIPDSPSDRTDPEAVREQDIGEAYEADALDLPSFDPGEPVDPETLADPPADLLPAPGLPAPPGREDLEIPPIEPGEILPPPADSSEISPRPGQVELPQGVHTVAATADRLVIHPTLSSGVVQQDQRLEMILVVQVADTLGRTVDLAGFDIDGELSVVLLDPQQPAEQARLGRWDFHSSQIGELVQQIPVSSLQIPLQWVGDRPLGDHVVAHVRLRGADDELRCQQRLPVEASRRITDWTPRGDDARR